MTYQVTLEADGRRTDAEAARKIRALLHRLANVYGVKVVRVTSTPTGQHRPVESKEVSNVRSN